MNIATIILGVLLIALGGIGFTQEVLTWYAGGVVALGVAVLAASFLGGSKQTADPEAKVETPSVPPVKEVKPRPEGEEAVMLLNRLQEKGRFFDFLMDDVSIYTDEQVGAAARVVHQGCNAVVKEAFAPAPVSDQTEGQDVTLPVDYSRESYQLSGQVEGEPPFTGSLIHKGWRATKINLPRRVGDETEATKVIAPATVEVR